MNTKLTLTIEDSVIKNAKKYAKFKKNSLSKLIENYLKILVEEKIERKSDTISLVNSLRGSFKNDDTTDYKKVLSKRLSEKYL